MHVKVWWATSWRAAIRRWEDKNKMDFREVGCKGGQ
jgi:hypothetical protein